MQERPNILIVDDESVMRSSLEAWFKAHYRVVTAKGGEEAVAAASQEHFDVAIVDLRMPGMDGIDVLKRVRKGSPDTAVILMTAYASVGSAVTAMKEGAYDYITKPFTPEEIGFVVERVVERQMLLQENQYLKRQLESRYSFENIVGKSHQMQKIYAEIERVAETFATVLILGESGTGKEIIARAIHQSSPRRAGPFIAVSCGAIPETLLEAELFGYEKGSFTGASSGKKGKFELANQGTIFLDEIGEISSKCQVDLLRVLQEKELRRIGGTELVKLDVRVIAATNKNLETEMEKGRFRDDLFYRINVVSIRLPALRERKEDIPLLARHFLKKFRTEYKKEIKDFSQEAIDAMMRYDWPGNVRELENAVEQAVILETKTYVQPNDLPRKIVNNGIGSLSATTGLGFNLRENVQSYEKQLILRALDKASWHKGKAAKSLGITPRNLSHYLKKYNISNAEDKDKSEKR